MTTTPADVALWMKSTIEQDGFLYQDVAATEIATRFGDQFTYVNNNGNLAISPDVLQSFRSISADHVVWERGQRLWRKRADYDLPTRQQQ